MGADPSGHSLKRALAAPTTADADNGVSKAVGAGDCALRSRMKALCRAGEENKSQLVFPLDDEIFTHPRQ